MNVQSRYPDRHSKFYYDMDSVKVTVPMGEWDTLRRYKRDRTGLETQHDIESGRREIPPGIWEVNGKNFPGTNTGSGLFVRYLGEPGPDLTVQVNGEKVK